MSSRLSRFPILLRQITSARWHIAAIVHLWIATYILHGTDGPAYWRFDDPQMLNFIVNYSVWEGFYRPEIWQQLGAPFFTPLLTLSYWGDLQAFGLIPQAYHLHQLAVLFLAAVLTYGLLLRRLSATQAWLGGLLCLAGTPTAVVAQQTMTRHYIEGLVFALATVYCYLFSRNRPWLAWFGGVLYLLAMLAKEVYIPLLFLLPVLERHPISSVCWRRLVPYGLALTVYIPWRFYMLHGVGGYSPQLLPSLSQSIYFLAALPSWLFGGGVWGYASIGLAFLVLGAGIRNATLRMLPMLLCVLLLAIPLLPIVAIQSTLTTGYFIPQRYMFLPWWALACSLALSLAQSSVRQPLAQYQALRQISDRQLLTLLVFIFALAMPARINQHRCLSALMAENEHIYRLALEGEHGSIIYAPRHLIPYLEEMLGYLHNIDTRPGASLPALTSDPLSGLQTFRMHYDPIACFHPD